MKRPLVQRFLIVAVGLIVISGSFLSFRLIAQAQQNSRVRLNTQTAPLVHSSRLLGATDGKQQLNLSIGLQPRNSGDLEGLIRDLYDPRSSRYHHFLTPQQFAAEFGPTSDQQQQVVSYLRSQGIVVTSISPNGLLIDARTSVAQAESVFQVSIKNYQLGKRTFFANANPPSIPSSLAGLVISIGGLDNSVQLHPLLHRSLPTHRSRRATSHAAQAGYGPTELRSAYDANPLEQAGVQGNNQTVAVFELDGYQSSDITQYLQNYNLGSPNISNVLVDGSSGSAGQSAIEVELDIEVVAAMAPKANQIVYEGPNSTQGVNDTYNKIVTDNKAQITTISWGECESVSGNAELQTLDNIFKQGAAQGIAMFAASGDSGAYDCNDTNLAVDSPAGDPYITGVGGTNLQLNNGAYGSESVWSNPNDTQRSPKGAGGGGGISSVFAQPSWQTGPGVKNQYSNGNRQVPDVSADADPATGYAVYCTVSTAGCTGWLTVGGTSAAAPMWAGSTALMNEYLQQQGKSRMGFANPVLYGLENASQQYPPYHDVSSGNNLYYPATTNYDEASGWGSPDINNIARDVAGGTVPNPSPTPSPTGTPAPSPTPNPSPSPTNTPNPTGTPAPPPPSGSLIQNGGFEQGSSPWQESSASGYELVDSSNPHSGQYSAYLCGYTSCSDSMSQSFTVPSNASHIALNYWWYGDTSRTASSCTDSLTVQLLDSNHHVIGKVKRSCNTSANQSWQQVNADITSMLASYAGQTVTLIFTGKTGSAFFVTTSFYVDDVAINVS